MFIINQKDEMVETDDFFHSSICPDCGHDKDTFDYGLVDPSKPNQYRRCVTCGLPHPKGPSDPR